jgi:type IV pilus assembly protein PilC
MVIGSQSLERGRHARDAVALRLPVIGGLVRYASVARFCRTLGIMLEAGVPVARSMDIVINSVSNRVLAARLAPIRSGMLSGEGFAGPLSRTGVFPPTVIQMVRVGEETGALERFLADTADFYDNELEYRLQNAIQLFEPALILAVGLIVGFVAVSLVSAIYSLTAAIR